MPKLMQPKVGAVAVLLHEGKTLLVQRGKAPDKGYWGFPGGHVEWGESAMQAAVRELSEETGITARAVRYLDNVDAIRRDASGAVQSHYLLAAVLCEYVAGTAQAADDADAVIWASPQQILDDQITPQSTGLKRILELALGRADP